MKRYSFDNKTAIITGASSGIGKELSLLLMQKYNVKVIGVGRNEEKLKGIQNYNQKTKNLFTYYTFDVGVLSEWQKFYTYITLNNIKVDILVNCAGVLPKMKKIENTTITELESVLHINFLSQVYGVKTFLQDIKKSPNGLIINVASSSAFCTFSGIAMYSATKSATLRFTESLICEEDKIKVVCVLPGFTKTNIFVSQTQDTKASKIIDKIAKTPTYVANKIVKGIIKNKKRIVTGFDAKLMNFLYKFFPKIAPKIITKFLKNSKYQMFEDI